MAPHLTFRITNLLKPPILKILLAPIWEGKFVDLSILLKSVREISDHLNTQGQIQVRNGTMCLVKQKPRIFLSIDKWTSAFIIFTSVMLEKYRS